MKFKRKIFPNGLRVITIHMKDTPTVTVLAMVEAGSKYESKEKNGISHFLEHMVFKGTEKRPTAYSISKELDSIGSHYNAFTSEEYTGYYAKAAPKHLPRLLDVVSDLYLNPVFDEKELEKEKGVIIEEINMYKDLPHRHVQELFMNLLYGDQPAGWTITGPRENIQAMKREDFVEYRKQHYVAEATTVIVAGNFDEKTVQKEIKKAFGAISSAKKHKKVKTKDTQSEPQVLIETRPTDQAHMVLGVRGFQAGSPHNPTIRMLNAVLGAGMSSRLFQKLREEMGVGYYVRSSYDTYTDHGVFSVSVGADVSRVEEVVNAITAELKRFTTELVSKEELLKTQEYLIGMMYLGLESSDSIAEFYGYQEILRQSLKKPEDIVKEIRSVTPEKIRAMAKKVFVSKNLNLAIVGPAQDKNKLKGLLKF
jgi:predicted Zn-dependent peptidase